MNKREFFTELAQVCDKHGVKRENVIVYGGGASIFHGTVEATADIDVLVDETTMDNLSWEPAVIYHDVLPPNGNLPEVTLRKIGKVDFHWGKDLPIYPTISHRKFKILSKMGLLMFRIDLGRTKDVKDVKALSDLWSELDQTYKVKLKTFLHKHGVKNAVT
jgi:hypothetical protein